jgi:hypothetical protein
MVIESIVRRYFMVIESIVRRTILTTNVCAGDLFSRNAGCVERTNRGFDLEKSF